MKKLLIVSLVVLILTMSLVPVASATPLSLGEHCPAAKLNLTFMQPCKPAEGTPLQARWRVSNPNSFSVLYDVSKAGTGVIMSNMTALPGDNFFNTPWGAQTLIITWDGGSNTKAGGDSYNGTNCPVDILGCTDPNAKNYNPKATKDDGSCEYVSDPPETPPPPEPKCELKPMYWQDEFVKEGFPSCYLVTWQKDSRGNYIPAASRSQLCNCGWIADNVVYGDYVYLDCHGTWWYHGEVWAYGKPDMVLPHWSGTCAAGGGGGECSSK